MADMQAVAALGPIMQLAGTAMDTTSKVMAADTNAKVLDAQARGIEEDTHFQLRQFGREAKLKAGSNVAQAAASGVDITKGSPLFAELDFAKQAAIESESIRRSGKMGYDSKKFQSRLAKQQMTFNLINGVTGAFGSRPGQPGILERLVGK
jgi:hypothetical protein